MRRARAAQGQSAFTLIEIIVVVGLILLLGAGTVVVLAKARAPFTTTRADFASILGQAKALAQTRVDTQSGTVVVVRPYGAGSMVQVLLGRPVAGFSGPSDTANIPTITTAAAILLSDQDLKTASLAIAPSGHVDFIPAAVTVGEAPLERAPGCSATQTITVQYQLSSQSESHMIDCQTGTISP